MFYELEKILRSRTISKNFQTRTSNLKVGIYLIVIRSVDLCEIKTWPLKKETEKLKITVIERNSFRKIDKAYFDAQTSERRKLDNDKIKIFFQRPDMPIIRR